MAFQYAVSNLCFRTPRWNSHLSLQSVLAKTDIMKNGKIVVALRISLHDFII